MIQRFWLYIKSNQLIALVPILILAGMLRFWQIESIPSGFYWDEAAITYDAWGISIDGKDQWGVSYPLIFKSFGDGKLPLVEYILAFLFTVGGFHMYWIRYLAATAGVCMVLGIYFLSKKLFPQSASIPLVASFLVATSSWAIHFSRFGLEAGIGTALMVWSVFFLYYSKNKWESIIGVVLLALSVYTYHSNLLLAPFISLFLGWKKIRVILFILLMIPLFWALQETSWTRAGQTLFWNAPGYTFTGSDIAKRIGSQLSPAFWFEGVQPNLRQAVPHYFALFPIELLFLVAGFIALQNKQRLSIFGLLAICLIPSFIGNPSPHTIRAFNMMPFLKIIEAYGLYALFKKSRILALLIIGVYAVTFGMFWRYYISEYPSVSASDFQYGYKQMLSKLQKTDGVIEQFVVSPGLGQPYIYTLLHWNISPPEFRAGGLANVTFRPIQWPESSSENTLYAGLPSEIPPDDSRVKSIIYSPDSNVPIWVIAK